MVNFIGGVKPEYPEKNTDLSYVTDKLYHMMLYIYTPTKVKYHPIFLSI